MSDSRKRKHGSLQTSAQSLSEAMDIFTSSPIQKRVQINDNVDIQSISPIELDEVAGKKRKISHLTNYERAKNWWRNLYYGDKYVKRRYHARKLKESGIPIAHSRKVRERYPHLKKRYGEYKKRVEEESQTQSIPSIGTTYNSIRDDTKEFFKGLEAIRSDMFRKGGSSNKIMRKTRKHVKQYSRKTI